MELTPGRPFSVSPKVLSRRRDNSRPPSTDTGCTNSNNPLPSGLAVTTTGGNSAGCGAVPTLWASTAGAENAMASATAVFWGVLIYFSKMQ